jgi:hypothetical protein
MQSLKIIIIRRLFSINMAWINAKRESTMTSHHNNHDDEESGNSSANISSYQRQTISNLRKSGVTTEDVISSQTGTSQKKVDKIRSQDAKKEEVVGKNKYLKEKLTFIFLTIIFP